MENLLKNFLKQSINLQKPLNILKHLKTLFETNKKTFLNLGNQGADIQAGWGTLEQTIQYPGGELFQAPLSATSIHSESVGTRSV